MAEPFYPASTTDKPKPDIMEGSGMHAFQRGVSLVLIVSMASQMLGCFTTRMHRTVGEEIKFGDLRKGQWVLMTLKPECALLKTDLFAREFGGVIDRVDPQRGRVTVTVHGKAHPSPPSYRFEYTVTLMSSDIQKIEIIHTTKGEEVFSPLKTAVLFTGGIVILAAIIMLVKSIGSLDRLNL
jgi:hypothetical protein